MKRNTLLLFFLVLPCLFLPGFSQAAPVEVLSAEFGTFDASNPKEIVFEPTAVVAHRVGQRYGWIIEVRTTQPSLSVREEYVMPKPMQAEKAPDPISEVLNEASLRRNQVSQRQLVPVDRKIYGEWEIGANEPAGHRNLRVIIEGQEAASFEYDVK